MSCKDIVPKDLVGRNRYLAGLGYLPDDYLDAWSGCKVTFSWGSSGEQYGLPASTYVPRYSMVCGGKGAPAYDVVRKALIADCEKRAPLPVADPDPSSAFVPPPVTVAQWTQPLIPVTQEETVPYYPVITRQAAATSVPVSTRPGISTGLLQQPSALTIGSFPGLSITTTQPTGGVIPGMGTSPQGVGGAGFWEWVQGLVGQALPNVFPGVFGGETPTSPGTQPTGFTSGCPTGFHFEKGQCVPDQAPWYDPFWPGAQGAIPTNGVGVAQTPVQGQYGPAYLPSQAGTVMTKEGVQRPILRCRAGQVLGKDSMCYNKGAISNKQRKHPRGRQPLLTGGDMRTLSKISSLQRKVQKTWTAAGRPGQRKCATTRRKK